MVKGNSVVSVGVEVGGGGLVGHVGLWLLGRFADRLGVGKVLSEAFRAAPGVTHDRGTVLVQAMLMLSGGGEACTDIEFLRAEPGLFGSVGSAPTLYRTMRSIGADERARLGGAMGEIRGLVWDRLAGTEVTVLDIDSSVHQVHSENKAGTAAAYQGGFGFHPIYCFWDRTGECLAATLRPGNAAANNIADHTDVLDRALEGLPERIRVGHRPFNDPATVTHPVMVRADSAAGPRFAAECRLRNVGFSFVARGANQIQEAIGRVAHDDPRWQPALLPDSKQTEPHSEDSRSQVADLTEFVDMSRWPKGTRLIVRREPRHPGSAAFPVPLR